MGSGAMVTVLHSTFFCTVLAFKSLNVLGVDVTLPNLVIPFYAVFKEPGLLGIVRMVIGKSNG